MGAELRRHIAAATLCLEEGSEHFFPPRKPWQYLWCPQYPMDNIRALSTAGFRIGPIISPRSWLTFVSPPEKEKDPCSNFIKNVNTFVIADN